MVPSDHVSQPPTAEGGGVIDIEFDTVDDFKAHSAIAAPEPELMSPLRPKAKGFVPVKHLQDQLDRQVGEYIKRLTSQPGSPYDGLDVKAGHVSVRPKALPGASKVLLRLIDRIITSTGAAETQAALRDAVRAEFPEHSFSKDWTRPLPAWAIKHANDQISKSAGPFTSLKVKAPTTLSELHKQAAAAVTLAAGGEQKFQATVTITAKHVFVNGEKFSITDSVSAGRIYRTARIRIDSLTKALRC